MLEIFGLKGLLARAHPDYEYRAGQVKMAEAVLAALENQRHLIVEAGTGTGKTLAYLVPAVAYALGTGSRVIVSTGTKNLQEQLMEKDIPFLQKVLPRKFFAAYMKGRSNYACLNKIKKHEDSPLLEGVEEIDYFDTVRRWARESQTGDRAELVTLPENLSFWRHIDARSETCLGQKCPDFDACFITRMRQNALNAEIVIVNHHLFFADLALRGQEYGQVLPDYGAVIFDEAHLIEDVAAEYFGSQVSSYQLEDLIRDVSQLPLTDVETNKELTKIMARVSRFADAFWLGFRTNEEGRSLLVPGTFARKIRDGEIEPTPLGANYLGLDGALERLASTLDALKEPTPESENLVRRTRQARFDLNFIVSGDEATFVYWLERRGRGTFLRASPIDVSGLLQEKLFARTQSIVLTSATLTSAGSFNFVRSRLGLSAGADEESDSFDPTAAQIAAKTDELIAPSSFDYERQAVLYLPQGMPDPRSREWADAAADEIERILDATRGRAFVLSTSFAAMNALYERVAPAVDFPCFVQGEASKAGVLEKFRKAKGGVLFATSSFWQGVDVRGETLSCVIIEKLPFAVPTDPVVAARQRYLDNQGASSFFEYSVPQAVISLKQGTGRLIRSATDRGALAILDPRLQNKGYGKYFLRSLPRMRITNNVADIAAFFNSSQAASRH